MKPPVCNLCGKPAWDETGPRRGDSVEFANYKPYSVGEDVSIGHPAGLEYFCDSHIDAARKLVHLSDAEALTELRKIFGDAKWQAPKRMPWWKGLFATQK
jgi:hypothetical protein